METIKRNLLILALAAAFFSFAGLQAHAQAHTIYDSPQGYLTGVIRDNTDNLYFGNFEGGLGAGSIIELSLGTSGEWSATTLYQFSGPPDGSDVFGNLVFDSAGNLYGTTSWGGTGNCVNTYNYVGCGTVFELSPVGNGQWTEKILYSFADGTDGRYPYAGVVLDASGNIYGTTQYGGESNGDPLCFYGCGTVFKLTPNQTGQWTETILHTFGNTNGDGVLPLSEVVLDANGNIYGTTQYGGANICNYGGEQVGCGTVFILKPSQNGQWVETVLSFNGSDGAFPIAGLTFDSAGNLYGTASGGGTNTHCAGCGVVFELSPAAGGGWYGSVIHTFFGYDGPDGAIPWGGLTIDSAGNLYGTTEFGGTRQQGTVFKMSPTSNGGWTKTATSLNGRWTGFFARSAPVLDSSGNVFGSTYAGGTGLRGVVYEIKP